MMVQGPPRFIVEAFQPWINEFAARAIAVYQQVPFRLTSYWRDPESNRRAGGHQFSQHLIGLALDAVADDLLQLEVELSIRGLSTVRYQTHVHAQLWKAGRLERLARG